MGLRIPFSRNKRYLTGIDWVIGMFDHILKRAGGTGNTSQIILHLDRPIPEDGFRQAFNRFASAFPVLQGRPARDWNLAPYWRIPSSPPPFRVRLDVRRFPADTPADRLLGALADSVNEPFERDDEHLAFSLAQAGDCRAFLGLRIDHRLFDARGAETFLDLFQRWQAGEELDAIRSGIRLVEPARLSDWAAKFRAGQRVNRALLALREASHPTFDYARIQDYRTRFRFLTFSPAESEQIAERAYRDAGYLMLMPSLMAAGVEALHRVFRRKGIQVPDYVVPASFDMRRPNRVRTDLFFNHVSFVFFRIRAADIEDRGRLIGSIKQQFYDNNRSGLIQDFRAASDLMRIAPFGLLTRLARLPLAGQLGSFSFSQVGDAFYTSPSFMDARVLNLLHTPRVPIPPGLGFFFNRCLGQINFTLSYLPDLLTESEADTFMEALGRLREPAPSL